MRPDVFIMAAEPSGDALAAGLARELKRRSPDIVLSGIGGPALDRAGIDSQMDIEGLAILGFVEGLRSYRLVLRKVREAVRAVLAAQPRAVVLIDSWGFMVRVAKALKASGYDGLIIKYVAPQVWAMRAGRAKILARHVDHLLSTQPMDAPYFEAARLPSTFVGNPVLDQDFSKGDADRFRLQHGLVADRRTIGFFMGSRPSEIVAVGPAIIEAHDRLKANWPDLQAVFVVAETVRPAVLATIGERNVVTVDQSEFLDAVAAMDGAVACSGTVTTQLAAAGVPSVVLYRLSPLTFAVASRLFKPRYISLVNISADMAGAGLETPLLPEFVQHEIMTDAPSQALIDLLEDADAAAQRRIALIEQTRQMGAGSGSASGRAADAVLALLDRRSA